MEELAFFSGHFSDQSAHVLCVELVCSVQGSARSKALSVETHDGVVIVRQEILNIWFFISLNRVEMVQTFV